MNRPGHGPNDFEDRLRAALRRRADEVVPDPRLWNRVQERAAGRRTARWLGAVATVAPLLAAVAVAVALGLPDRRADVDVADLRPAATATPAAPTETPVAPPEASPPPTERVAPPPAPEETATVPAETQEVPSGGAPQDRVLVLATSPGLVVSDANARTVDVVVTEPASQPGECDGTEGCEAEVVSDIRARPGSSAADIAVTFLESFEPCLGAAGYAIRSYGGEGRSDDGVIALPDAPCPAAPVWSPDGTRLAWLERPAEGGLELVTVPWDGDPVAGPTPAPMSRAAIAGDPALTGMASPRIVAWVAADVGALADDHDLADLGADAVLYVSGEASGGEPMLFTLPVASGGPGVEPLGWLSPAVGNDDGSSSLTYAGAGDTGVAYAVQRQPSAGDGRPLALALVRDGSATVPAPPALDLPAELVDPAAPLGERVWLRARGGEVLFGDGVDQAWRVRWDGAAWSPLEPLPGPIRSADFLEPAGS